MNRQHHPNSVVAHSRPRNDVRSHAAANNSRPTNPYPMKHILCIYLVLAASLTAFAADNSDDAKAVQGNWKPVKAELAGQPMADAVLKSISLKLDNGKYEVFVGDEPDRGTYTLDSAT